MELKAVHHVALLVSNYEKSKEFYVKKLGFEIIRENFREDRQDYKLDLKLDDVELEIFAPAAVDSECTLHPKRLSYPEAYGLRHLAFRVNDIHKAVAELEKAGIKVDTIRTDEFSGGRFAFFQDPDGIPLELHE